MRNTIPDIIETMRFHAEENIKTDERNRCNGILSTEGALLKMYADDLEEVYKDKKNLLLDLLDEFRHKTYCNKNFSDCLDCENHMECNAIRNVLQLVSTGKLLTESEL